MVRTGITCLVLSVLIGCAAPVSLDESSRPPDRNQSTAPLPKQDPDPDPVQVLPVDPSPGEGEGASGIHSPDQARLRGVMSAQGLQLCGQNRPKQIQGNPETASALESFLARHPFFFLDAWGQVAGDTIELESVERMVLEGSGCAEPLDRFAWIAQGHEPFWVFAMTHAGVQLRIRGEQPRMYAYTTPQIDAEQVTYVGVDYRLTLYRRSCVGATSNDAHYAWTAALQTGEQRWQGCAWQGMQIR